MTFSRAIQVNSTVSTTALPTTPQSTVTYDGVTFTFDRQMPVGVDELGEPFVVSDQAFSITSVSPASQVVNGAWANGLMIDPYIHPDTKNAGNHQGFDEFLSLGTGSLSAANTPYTHSLNRDVAAQGAIAVASGQSMSLVKSVRLGTANSSDQWQTIEKYVTLSVVPFYPQMGWFRAGASATDKTGMIVNLNLSALRSVILPGSFPKTPATAIADVPASLGLFGAIGEQLRRLRLDKVKGTSSTNYSADVSDAYGMALMALHASNLATPDRAAFARRCIRFALDVKGLADRGSSLSAGAGQGLGIGVWLYVGAFLTNNAAMLTAARALDTQTTSARWVQASEVGRATAQRSGGYNAQTFFDEHVDVPVVVPDLYGSNLDVFYGLTVTQGLVKEILSILMLQNGPGSVDGADAILDGGVFNETNPKAANIALLDRARTYLPDVDNQRDIGAWWNDMYDLVRPLTGLSSWTGRPDQIPQGDSAAYNDDIFSPGAGAFSWDIFGFDYATEPVVSRDVEYALDLPGQPPVQFVRESGVLAQGSKTGLLHGATHWCRIRQVSASGAGLWSANYPYQGSMTDGTGRGKVTTTGSTLATAPSYAGGVLPTLHYRLHPAWDFPTWAPANATLQADQVNLAAGLGYPATAYPAPSFAFQWRRNGAAIPAATSQSFTRTAADAGAVLTCDVTASNASGSDMVTTAGVTCPPLAVVPRQTLIDTDFRGAFAIDYEAELASVTSNNAIIHHEPSRSDVEGQNYGILRAEKAGGTPSLTLPLKNPATAGVSYAVTAQLVGLLQFSFHKFLGELFFEIRNGSGTVFYAATFALADDKTEEFLDIAGTFLVPAGEADLNLTARIGGTTGSGGGDGGDVALSLLQVSQT